MKSKLSLSMLLLIVTACAASLLAFGEDRAQATPQSVSEQVIAREKASFEAWQRKDKTFFQNYMADDSTYFSSDSPYLQSDPKTNFLPKFDKYVEMFKINDYQMYNPRVQIYGDMAILTYNSSVSVTMGGQPLNYTAKVTSVYVKQGGSWRVVHAHESMNPGAK